MSRFKVWLAVEEVDEETGDKISDDLDLPFSDSGSFETAEAALDHAQLMHDLGRKLAPYVEHKHGEGQ